MLGRDEFILQRRRRAGSCRGSAPDPASDISDMKARARSIPRAPRYARGRCRKHRRVDLHLVEDGSDHALLLEDQGAQKMHGIDVVLAALDGQFMGPFQGFAGFGCELIDRRHRSDFTAKKLRGQCDGKCDGKSRQKYLFKIVTSSLDPANSLFWNSRFYRRNQIEFAV